MQEFLQERTRAAVLPVLLALLPILIRAHGITWGEGLTSTHLNLIMSEELDDGSPFEADSSPLVRDHRTIREDREYKRRNKIFLAVVMGTLAAVFVVAAIGLGVGYGTKSDSGHKDISPYERAVKLLDEFPVIDG